jgi:hypothetical protein
MGNHLKFQNVVCEGDPGDCLFIVFKGTVAGYCYTIDNDFGDDHSSEKILKRAYCMSEVFGKTPALFYDTPYNKVSIRATYTPHTMLPNQN